MVSLYSILPFKIIENNPDKYAHLPKLYFNAKTSVYIDTFNILHIADKVVDFGGLFSLLYCIPYYKTI